MPSSAFGRAASGAGLNPESRVSPVIKQDVFYLGVQRLGGAGGGEWVGEEPCSPGHDQAIPPAYLEYSQESGKIAS